MDNIHESQTTINESREPQESETKESVCLNCQLMPQLKGTLCLPMLTMLKVGRELGVQVTEICFGVSRCEHIVPLKNHGSN